MIKVYKEVPWVKRTRDAKEYDLLGSFYWTYYTLDGKEEDPPYGQIRCSFYVNPKYIETVEDKILYDEESNEYPMSKLTMENGETFYIDCLWSELKMEEE